jgi:hypothetical protein
MLDRKTSLAVGLGTAALVYGVYDLIMPEVVNIRAADSNDAHVAAAEKAARWTSGGLVIGLTLITRDTTVFIIPAVMVIALSWGYRHANLVDPARGNVMLPSSASMVHNNDTVGSTAAYSPAG